MGNICCCEDYSRSDPCGCCMDVPQTSGPVTQRLCRRTGMCSVLLFAVLVLLLFINPNANYCDSDSDCSGQEVCHRKKCLVACTSLDACPNPPHVCMDGFCPPPPDKDGSLAAEMPAGMVLLVLGAPVLPCVLLASCFFCSYRMSYRMEPCCYCCCRWQCVDRRLAQIDFCSRWCETCAECSRRLCPWLSSRPGDISIDVEGLLPDGSDRNVVLTPIQQTNPVWDLLVKLLRVTDPHNLGIGRDVREPNPYSSISVVRAWKINSPIPKARYEVEKSEVRQHAHALCGGDPPASKTKLDDVSVLLGLDASINEKILLHGTKPENLTAILHNGLNERFSGGLFGKGVYLAEDPSKVDQYCTAIKYASMPTELKELLKDSSDLAQPVCFVLVCRLAVGLPVYTKDGNKNMHPPFQSLFTSADKRELSVIPGSSPAIHFHTLVAQAGPADQGFKVARHREFVVFHAQRLLPEFLVAVQRRRS
eukprot:TRINITY_DN104672_c0_g1_i1.p1 TRINITY_DN104672_c0_g1~~TRINITY_DN104672_c0_g1_i1.p1  ORF type:complete len:478 (+),score=60.36 TRINITY_DN104672_c0_g1_i1:49-1482(+)